jgi:hypothetical protein
MPRVIELPETIRMEASILPGQNAGFFGATHDPFRVTMTTDAQVVPPEFAPRPDNPPEGLAARTSLLEHFDAHLAAWQRQ